MPKDLYLGLMPVLTGSTVTTARLDQEGNQHRDNWAHETAQKDQGEETHPSMPWQQDAITQQHNKSK